MDNADRTRVRESLGRPSSSGSDGAPPKKYGPAAGQNRATLQGLENMRPTEQKFDINFTLPFARTTSGDRSCVVEALDGVRGPGTAGILADVKLSSEDTLAEYVSAQNLAHVRSVRISFGLCISWLNDLEAVIKALVPLLQGREFLFRADWLDGLYPTTSDLTSLDFLTTTLEAVLRIQICSRAKIFQEGDDEEGRWADICVRA